MSWFYNLYLDKTNPPAETHPDFSGRTVIVTGASSGLGLEAAIKFAHGGASRLILAVRSPKKGEAAKARIEAEGSGKTKVDIWDLDMLDYGSMHAFAARCKSELKQLHYVVLNAGVNMPNHTWSPTGFETTMQVNALSTVLLAVLLLPQLRASRTPDFVPVLEFVNSGEHVMVKMQPAVEAMKADPINAQNSPQTYHFMQQYGVAKLYLMYATQVLAERMLPPDSKDGTPEVYVVAVCPGACASDLAREHTGYIGTVLKSLFLMLSRTTEEGARTYISGVTLGKPGHGQFWQSDEIKTPIPLLTGEKGKELRDYVWKSIVHALRKDERNLKVAGLQY